MANAIEIREYRKNNLLIKDKEEKEKTFIEFLEKVKKINIDRDSEMDMLAKIRGIK